MGEAETLALNITPIPAVNNKPDQVSRPTSWSTYSLRRPQQAAVPNSVPKFSIVYQPTDSTEYNIYPIQAIDPQLWPNPPQPRHAAHAAAMVDPAGDGVQLLHVTIAMLTLSWVTLSARLAVRRWLKPEAMGADDYLMFAGLVGSPTLACFNGFSTVAAMSHGSK